MFVFGAKYASNFALITVILFSSVSSTLYPKYATSETVLVSCLKADQVVSPGHVALFSYVAGRYKKASSGRETSLVERRKQEPDCASAHYCLGRSTYSSGDPPDKSTSARGSTGTPFSIPVGAVSIGNQYILTDSSVEYSDSLYAETMVAERLARSPPSKTNRVQSPAGSPNFRKWESCRTMPFVGGFFRGYPVSPATSFRRTVWRIGCKAARHKVGGQPYFAHWPNSLQQYFYDIAKKKMSRREASRHYGIPRNSLELKMKSLKENNVSAPGRNPAVPPERLWNCDETNLLDDPANKLVITKRGYKYPEDIRNYTKAATSIIMFGNAAGFILPPHVYYKAEKLWNLFATYFNPPDPAPRHSLLQGNENGVQKDSRRLKGHNDRTQEKKKISVKAGKSISEHDVSLPGTSKTEKPKAKDNQEKKSRHQQEVCNANTGESEDNPDCLTRDTDSDITVDTDTESGPELEETLQRDSSYKLLVLRRSTGQARQLLLTNQELTCGNVPFPRNKQNTTTSHVDLSHVCNILYVVYFLSPLTRRARCDVQRHLHKHGTSYHVLVHTFMNTWKFKIRRSNNPCQQMPAESSQVNVQAKQPGHHDLITVVQNVD
ncbi:hypothetical protein PR048_005571 [Dryococelus australis]|uniref:HTH psq-type domain-containing protein n=1 Tax=Dryococelus australis TaxID=614101 RepID=A0ABQ9I9R9_9NEOP|nr:hypothetical protein PR048_005571 [Dryococelus australis]